MEQSESCRKIFAGIRRPRKRPFLYYKKCVKQVTNATIPCLDRLGETCRDRKLVATKVVRLTMNVVEELLKVLPDLKVVHYIRDPRAVAISRMKHRSFRGLYARGDIVRIAKLYCDDVFNDLVIRKRLQKQYPDTFLEVYFEELAMFPSLIAFRIYDFLGVEMPKEVYSWITENTQSNNTKQRTSRDSQSIVHAWKSKLKDTELKAINRVCQDMIKEAHMEWPDTAIL